MSETFSFFLKWREKGKPKTEIQKIEAYTSCLKMQSSRNAPIYLHPTTIPAYQNKAHNIVFVHLLDMCDCAQRGAQHWRAYLNSNGGISFLFSFLLSTRRFDATTALLGEWCPKIRPAARRWHPVGFCHSRLSRGPERLSGKEQTCTFYTLRPNVIGSPQ